MKVEADRRPADAQSPDQDPLDEVLCRCARELRVKTHDHRAVEARGGQQAQLVVLTREGEQRLLWAEEFARMRREGQRRRLAPEAACAGKRRADHRAMAAMHAVEIADCDHSTLQRAGVAFSRIRAHNMKNVGNGRPHPVFASKAALFNRLPALPSSMPM